MNTSPLLRQFLVAGSTQLAAFSVGGAVAYPTLLLEQFKTNDTSIQLDLDTSSWIGSIYGLAGIPAILMPIITQKIGRKFGYIITCLFLMTGWILSYTATSSTGILISESFNGLGTNSLLPISLLSMTEMLAPRYRSVAMLTFGILQGIGMAVCGIAGRFLHYKTLSIINAVPVAIAILIALIWSESPSWFACKGQFENCEKAFVKLRGTDDVSDKELKELIIAQKENMSRSNLNNRTNIKDFLKTVRNRDFYIPTLHTFILLNMLYWSGGDVVLIYFIQMVKDSTNYENATFYTSIILYLIILIGCIITNFLVMRYKNKTILLCSTCGVIFFLICLSLVTFLQSLSILESKSSLFMYCLIGFVTCNSLGLNSIVFLLGAEVMPVKHRSIGGALYIIFNCSLYASSLKCSPYLFDYIGMSGTFLIYTVNCIISAFIVWKYIPETKGRTLQEIEDFYRNGRFVKRFVCSDSITTSIKASL